jgi:hypothetical protein
VRETPFDRLKRASLSGTLPHALLVSGGAERARLQFARDTALLLLGGADPAAGRKIDDGNCADLIRVAPDNGSIKVDAVRDLIEKMRLKPFSAGRIFVVIEDADLMNAQAQNKLLKTLEEPAGDSVIMLLAANTQALRATIRSRCVKISLGAGMVDIEKSVKDDAVKILSAALFGKPAQEAFALLGDHADDPFPLLDVMELFLRDIIVGGCDAELVADEDNREIARKMQGRNADALYAGIGIIEDTRAALRSGRMNRKNGLRDMVIRIKYPVGISG